MPPYEAIAYRAAEACGRLPLVLAVGVLRWVVRTLPVLLPLVVALLLLLVLLLGGQQDTAVGSR